MNSPDKTIMLASVGHDLIRRHGSGVLPDAGFEMPGAATADEAIAVLTKHDEARLLLSAIDMAGSMDAIPDGGGFLRKPWAEDRLVDRARAPLAF